MRSPRVIPMLLVCAMLVLSSVPGTVAARAVEVLDEELPFPISMATAVDAGTIGFVFGGFTPGSLLDTIVEVESPEGRCVVTEWKLPSERKLSAAVQAEDAIYVLGGVGYDGDPLDDVIRFVPGEGVEVREHALPYGIRGGPAVWSGTHILVFGNCLTSPVGQYDVIMYDPVTNTSQVLEDVLPVSGAGSSAVWVLGAAYIFGGRLNDTAFSDLVVRYGPGGDVQVMEARLPTPRFGTAAVWDGTQVYVVGGSDALVCEPTGGVPTEFLDDIVVFDPIGGTVRLHWARLPSPRDTRAAVWGEGRMLIIGGETAEGQLSEVVAFDPTAPFRREEDGADPIALMAILVVGVLVFASVFALVVRRWKAPPGMTGGPIRT